MAGVLAQLKAGTTKQGPAFEQYVKAKPVEDPTPALATPIHVQPFPELGARPVMSPGFFHVTTLERDTRMSMDERLQEKVVRTEFFGAT